MTEVDRPTAVDLFCGAGGMSLGVEQAGFDVMAALDIDPVNVLTYRRNFPSATVHAGDIDALDPCGLNDLVRNSTDPVKGPDKELDLLFGGPSCQGFSEIGRRDPDDPRNTLVHSFAEAVGILRPRVAVMENVTGLLFKRNKPVLDDAIATFVRAGYLVVSGDPFVLDAQDFGVPQRRERVFLIVARADWWSGYEDELTFEERPRTCVRDALSGLPSLDGHPELLDQNALKLSADDLKALKAESADYARSLRKRRIGYAYPRTGTSPSIMPNVAFTRHHPTTRRRFSKTQQGETEPVSRLPRLDPDGVAPTLRAGTNRDRGSFTSARPIHHLEDRVITVREGARLHSFPDWFRFHETRWHGFRQVGNSVPPFLAAAVAESLMEPLGVSPTTPERSVALGNPDTLGMSLNESADHVGLDRDYLPTDVRSVTDHG